MRECTLITESRVEECGIVAQVVKCAPRVCGDDPGLDHIDNQGFKSAPRVCGDDPEPRVLALHAALVLPAYAGMILVPDGSIKLPLPCSPRMRG